MYRCELCERWFCKKHLEPRLAFIKDLNAIENIPEVRALYFTESEQLKSHDGHPDFEYSRRKYTELKLEEKRLNELIKQALDRMNHYYEGIPEKPVDAEADRKKRVEILSREEREIREKPKKEEQIKLPKGVETVVTRYGFDVPSEVYSNATYREYLEHADNLKSVKVIVDEYYRKYPKKKKFW